MPFGEMPMSILSLKASLIPVTSRLFFLFDFFFVFTSEYGCLLVDVLYGEKSVEKRRWCCFGRDSLIIFLIWATEFFIFFYELCVIGENCRLCRLHLHYING